MNVIVPMTSDKKKDLSADSEKHKKKVGQGS